jgi:hypothetical protein
MPASGGPTLRPVKASRVGTVVRDATHLAAKATANRQRATYAPIS